MVRRSIAALSAALLLALVTGCHVRESAPPPPQEASRAPASVGHEEAKAEPPRTAEQAPDKTPEQRPGPAAVPQEPKGAETANGKAAALSPKREPGREGPARLGSKKRIAITFDGDPVPAFVTRAMDEAERYGGKVTFFLVSENLAHKPEVVPSIEKRGHEIGNHSYSHPHLDRCSEEKIRYQLGHTNDIIAEQGGSKPTFMRPPFGDHNARSDRICRELGMKVVLWDVDPTDWREGKPGEKVLEYVLNHAKPDAVVLLHQGDNTYGILERLFAGLNEQGFSCVRLDELPRYPQDVGVYPK